MRLLPSTSCAEVLKTPRLAAGPLEGARNAAAAAGPLEGARTATAAAAGLPQAVLCRMMVAWAVMGRP